MGRSIEANPQAAGCQKGCKQRTHGSLAVCTCNVNDGQTGRRIAEPAVQHPDGIEAGLVRLRGKTCALHTLVPSEQFLYPLVIIPILHTQR